MSEPDGHPMWEHLNSRCGTECPYCRIAELEAVNAELEKVSSYSLLRQNDRLKAENAKFIKANIDVANINAELQAELATLKEKARAAVNAPYEDVLDMGLAQALRELKETIPE